MDYFTDLDLDINYDNQTWKSSSLRFEGLQRKISIGTDVDEQTLKIWAAPGDTMFGSNFLEGAQEGLLDGALLVRYRAIWPFVTGNAAVDVANNQPLAVWPLFTGYVSSIDKGGASHVEMKVKSALMRLNVDMPRNFYQPGCLWTLFSQPGCTLNQDDYTITGTITSYTSTSLYLGGGIPNPTSGDGLPTYCQGRLLFTSGVNEGLLTIMDSNDSEMLHLAYPLTQEPSPGDTVSYWPGCSKSFNTCQVKFNNTTNFRGFDKVPPIMVST